MAGVLNTSSTYWNRLSTMGARRRVQLSQVDADSGDGNWHSRQAIPRTGLINEVSWVRGIVLQLASEPRSVDLQHVHPRYQRLSPCGGNEV
jgi:hypothetical protein